MPHDCAFYTIGFLIAVSTLNTFEVLMIILHDQITTSYEKFATQLRDTK